jgi:PKHD-type hydroxylase
MNLINDYYYFSSAISKEFCSKIISCSAGKFYDGLEGRSGDVTIYRKNSVYFLDDSISQEVYNLVWPLLHKANDLGGWSFDIKSTETPQIAEYRKGQFYNWHCDGKSDSLSVYKKEDVGENEFLLGNVRKLSLTLNLNDGYEGGQFELAKLDRDGIRVMGVDNTIGSITIFPSFLMHRVRPVTKGIRYSLVMWFLGPPFK